MNNVRYLYNADEIIDKLTQESEVDPNGIISEEMQQVLSTISKTQLIEVLDGIDFTLEDDGFFYLKEEI